MSVLLESDPNTVASRVTKRLEDDRLSLGSSSIPLSEQTLAQALQTAKEQLAKSLLK
jgi:hypothetical protein